MKSVGKKWCKWMKAHLPIFWRFHMFCSKGCMTHKKNMETDRTLQVVDLSWFICDIPPTHMTRNQRLTVLRACGSRSAKGIWNAWIAEVGYFCLSCAEPLASWLRCLFWLLWTSCSQWLLVQYSRLNDIHMIQCDCPLSSGYTHKYNHINVTGVVT
jgi:hypothetical protein